MIVSSFHPPSMLFNSVDWRYLVKELRYKTSKFINLFFYKKGLAIFVCFNIFTIFEFLRLFYPFVPSPAFLCGFWFNYVDDQSAPPLPFLSPPHSPPHSPPPSPQR